MKTSRLETLAVHGGDPRPPCERSVAMPIFQSSTFVQDAGPGDYHSIRYMRLSNTPNHEALHRKLALLEGTEAAIVAASGMAIISTVLLALLKSGDHVIAQDCLYGGTHDLLSKDFPGFGLSASFFQGDDWESHLTPATRMIYVESVANPLLRVPDLERVVAFARKHRLLAVIDNTFPSPVNFQPAAMGFDVVLHSATKYLNGHTDIVAGAAMGSSELIGMVKRKLDHLGGTLDTHSCSLLNRGLKTLVLRVRHQNESCLKLAKWLSEHPAVAHVNYTGLASHADHARAVKWFRGHGGVLSFELKGGVEAADALFAKLRLPYHAPSLGGVETLITRPATSSHCGVARETRLAMGISDGLIRVSVGIEATEDLIADFAQALEA